MKIKRIVLSYSVLNAYKQCPQYFMYRYLKGLSKPEVLSSTTGSPLVFGQLAHKFLELYHGGVMPHEAQSRVMAEAGISSLRSVAPGETRSCLHLDLMMSKYLDTYSDPDSEFTPVLIENKPALEYENDFLLATLSNGCQVIWRQHYDGIVEMRDGSNAILEHKTSSGNLHEDLVQRMLPNDQAVGYVYGVKKTLSFPITGVYFNGLCTYRPLVNPGYKPRDMSKKAMPLFYRRFVEIADWQLDEWESETLRTVKRLIEDIEESVFGKNAPDACTLWNRRCAFADLCQTTGKNRANIIELAYETPPPWKGFLCEFEKDLSLELEDGTIIK